jgi:glycerophosphoryl diester phosphodiesterase
MRSIPLSRRALMALGLAGTLPALPLAAQPRPGWPTLDGGAPLVIAHRGASGYLPEHTLAAYELAVRLGADCIEPDLQLTRDGQLVAMHDATLERTTDVANRFAQRNGGWRVADFALEEIRQLTMRPQGSARLAHPGFRPSAAQPLRVPTLEEIIALARRLEAEGARPIGLYPELKQGGPRAANHVLQLLSGAGYVGSDRVFLQSFDVDTVRGLHRRQAALGLHYKLVLLNSAANRLLAMDLARVAGFAQGVGVNIRGDGMSRSFIALAHAAGLTVHGYTFQEPDPALALPEYRKFMAWGMDGVFSNYPDLALQARAAQSRVR